MGAIKVFCDVAACVMGEAKNTRVVILGGGFGGMYVALELEKTLAVILT
jgi:hypothetical protein